MKGRVLHCILIMFLMDILTEILGNLEMDISKKLVEDNGTILSRKRRYLTFPEGSSFQVVFDLTYPSVGMGNAFVFGHTAAMGWELPSTPIFLDKKKMPEEKEEKTENKTVEKVPEHLYHTVDNEYDLQKIAQSYYFPLDWHPPLQEDYQEHWEFTNPNTDGSYESAWTNIDRSPVTFHSSAFGSEQQLPQKFTFAGKGYPQYYKVSYKNPSDFWNFKGRLQNYRKEALRRPNVIRAFGDEMVPFKKTVTHHIHRRSRRELYTKIEKLFIALSKDGKACILKAICQVSKIPKGKGSMWEEILKAIFKVKPSDLYPDEDHYDKAANLNHDCDNMYPECDGHVLSNIFRKKVSK